MDELTIKEAQKRSRLKKLREKVDFSGKAVEHFSDEFRQIMNSLRDVDDSIREIAMGEKGSDLGQTLKDLLRVAETNFKRREYMTAITYLGRFHERVEAINVELAKLTNKIDTVHHRFLFEDIDPDQVEYLTRNLAPKFHKHTGTPPMKPSWLKDEKPAKKADTQNVIVVEGGIKDWWHNITSDRGKTLAGWEKRFPKYTREIKAQTSSMIARSQSLLDNLITTLKQLDSYRSTRKLEEYVQTAQRWRERYNAYNTAFISFYNSQIRRFIDYQDALTKKQEAAKGGTQEQLEQAEGEPHQDNTAKPWPPEAAEGKPASGKPTSGKPASEKPAAKSLHPLGKGDPIPEWDDLPESFQKVFNKFMLDTKKMKPWKKLDPDEKRIYYDNILAKLEKERKKKDVAFPPANPPHPSPLRMPEVEAPPATPKTVVPSDPTPAQTGEHPVVPFLPTERAPTPRVSTPHPLTPTLRFPGVEPISEPFPLVYHQGPLTEVEPMRPQIPLPPKLPSDLFDLSGGRRAHTEFLTALETKASKHPFVQAAFILDYAKTIEADAPEQCKSLRALASSILGK